MDTKIDYTFSSKLWKSHGEGGWHFVSLPSSISEEIRSNLRWQEEGWGRMKATASVNDVVWKTAIWFDKKADTYLLPVKADIRKKTGIGLGDVVQVTLSV